MFKQSFDIGGRNKLLPVFHIPKTDVVGGDCIIETNYLVLRAVRTHFDNP